MKKQNTLRALGALTLLLVSVCFLVTCDDGYQATVKGIRFCYQVQAVDEEDGSPVFEEDGTTPVLVNEEIDATHPFIVNATARKLIVLCDIPSSIKEITLKLTFDKTKLEITDEFSDHEDSDYNQNGTIDSVTYPGTEIIYKVTALTPFTTGALSTITITAEPGGKTVSCENVKKE
jgi:hypothetical protein